MKKINKDVFDDIFDESSEIFKNYECRCKRITDEIFLETKDDKNTPKIINLFKKLDMTSHMCINDNSKLTKKVKHKIELIQEKENR